MKLRYRILQKLGWRILLFEDCVMSSYGRTWTEGETFVVENCTIEIANVVGSPVSPGRRPPQWNQSFDIVESHPPFWYKRLMHQLTRLKQAARVFFHGFVAQR